MDRSYKIPSHFLDDLCSRFILNVPDDYRQDIIRTFFQIELAHWFYIDFFVPETPGLKAVGIKDFANQIFKHCPFLHSGSDDVDTLHQDWKAYKLSVPTYGVILLDPTLSYVLLVQGYSKSWGFPKGKVNEGEDPVKCAVRELMEETGCDSSGLINADHYVEHTAGDQYSRLYIVPGVPLDTHFLPQTRNEIRAMQWFPLEYLPAHKKDVSHSKELGCGPNSFFMVIPFIKQLRRWIQYPQGGYINTTPKAQRKEKKTDVQKAFAQKSLNQFEEILGMDMSAGEKLPSRKSGGRKGGAAGNTNDRTRSPQYKLLQKDRKEENLKKVTQLKQSLELNPADTRQTKIAAYIPEEQAPFKPCKEWKNFKLDFNAVMQAAMNPH